MGLFSWLKGGKKDAPAAQPSEAEPAGAPGDDEPVEDVAALAEALSAKNGAVRIDVARALLERWRNGDGEAAAALVARLDALFDDDESTVRQVALSAVRMMRKPENLDKHASSVLALLADKVASVRTAAVFAAARLPGETARVQVRQVLTSGEEPMRFAAATALAEAGDPAALPELQAALAEGHRRQEALSGIVTLGDAAALPALAALWEGEEAEALGEFDKTLLAAAMARFGDARGKEHLAERAAASGDDRPMAVEWAGRLGVTEATSALEELADEEGEPARGAALRALGRLKAPGAAERLLKLAQDAELSDDLRMDAAEGLAELGTDPALATLRDLSSGQGELADLCKELLGELAAQAATETAQDSAKTAPDKPHAD